MENASPSSFSDEHFLLSGRETKLEAPVAAGKRPRIHRVAVWLAVATVLSTFWAGVGAWVPMVPLDMAMQQSSLMPVRQALLANWSAGLQFSLGLMAILAAHELGHYVMTIIYRVPSTPPLFIPFPFLSPIGTMGAVIMMQSGQADRKQIFDIGLAGPLAGLLVAFPILVWGLVDSNPVAYAPSKMLVMGQPLLIQWLAAWLVPDRAASFVAITNNEASPLLMAAWVGLLVTGLNMMPLGQLDGGHVTFGLVGHNSFWIAVAAIAGAIAYMVYARIGIFVLMLILVLLMGLRHPPSSNDDCRLGWPRQLLGWCSLVLPVLCIPANPIDYVM